MLFFSAITQVVPATPDTSPQDKMSPISQVLITFQVCNNQATVSIVKSPFSLSTGPEQLSVKLVASSRNEHI